MKRQIAALIAARADVELEKVWPPRNRARVCSYCGEVFRPPRIKNGMAASYRRTCSEVCRVKLFRLTRSLNLLRKMRLQQDFSHSRLSSDWKELWTHTI